MPLFDSLARINSCLSSFKHQDDKQWIYPCSILLVVELWLGAMLKFLSKPILSIHSPGPAVSFHSLERPPIEIAWPWKFPICHLDSVCRKYAPGSAGFCAWTAGGISYLSYRCMAAGQPGLPNVDINESIMPYVSLSVIKNLSMTLCCTTEGCMFFFSSCWLNISHPPCWLTPRLCLWMKNMSFQLSVIE